MGKAAAIEPSILVVDDKAQNIIATTELLRRMEIGNKIYSAPNGKVGLELARKIQPVVILTDWEMPEMNGIELVRQIKSDPETSEIPIIMITAVMTDFESMNEAFDAGVHDYLRKPFHDLEFFARVRNTLRLQQTFSQLKEVSELAEKESASLWHANAKIAKLGIL